MEIKVKKEKEPELKLKKEAQVTVHKKNPILSAKEKKAAFTSKPVADLLGQRKKKEGAEKGKQPEQGREALFEKQKEKKKQAGKEAAIRGAAEDRKQNGTSKSTVSVPETLQSDQMKQGAVPNSQSSAGFRAKEQYRREQAAKLAETKTGLKPDGEDLSRAIKIAIEEANVTPFEIDYINAHGSGTKQNDINETGAYKKVFGELAYKIPMSSTKSMTGHPLGAASAVEAIVCCLALENNFMPPTINYNKKDALCDLDYIPNCGREKNLNVVLTNASGFGGLHAAMILKKYID